MVDRVYTIPLRKEFMKMPNWKRTPKAVKAIKEFVQKHMKVEEVKIGHDVNVLVWGKGIKNPPSRIKVNVKKEDNKASVSLFTE